jgi:hypothetical protein
MRELTATELVHVYGAGKKDCYDPCKKPVKVECDKHEKKCPKDHGHKDDCKPEKPECPKPVYC